MGLKLSGVRKAFHTRSGNVEVLNAIDLEVAAGELVAIVGESGVGKSTLVSLIAGYLPADEGLIRCGNEIVTGPGPDRIVVTQQDALMPWLTVGQNARYAGLVGHYRSHRQQIVQGADDLLHRFGLWSHRNKYPNLLSGGQRRRVELIRAFAVVPTVLLLDEPYSGLDEGLRLDLATHLLEWRREAPDVCVVLVTHDIEEACFLADRVVIMGGQPGGIVSDLRLAFGPWRERSLLLQSEFLTAVAEVRTNYFQARGTPLTK